MDARHTTDLMLSCLRSRDDKICADAADEIEWLHEHIKKLERRIHNQRLSLQKNWEIIEMRAQYRRAWYPSKLLMSILTNRRSGEQTR